MTAEASSLHLPPSELWTIGFMSPAKTRWKRLVAILQQSRMDVLVDIRHSPCASDPDPNTRSHYGPRQWNLQTLPSGIAGGLREVGIEYRWVVELGNPQKRDPEMLILRHHLDHPNDPWPVHRGLAILRGLMTNEKRRCCLLCACKDYATCHRTLIAEAICKLLQPARVQVTHL